MKRNPVTFLGWAVECHRKSFNMSRGDLARKAKCDEIEIYDLENGKTPRLSTLNSICEAFRLRLVDLVKYSEKMSH